MACIGFPLLVGLIRTQRPASGAGAVVSICRSAYCSRPHDAPLQDRHGGRSRLRGRARWRRLRCRARRRVDAGDDRALHPPGTDNLLAARRRPDAHHQHRSPGEGRGVDAHGPYVGSHRGRAPVLSLCAPHRRRVLRPAPAHRRRRYAGVSPNRVLRAVRAALNAAQDPDAPARRGSILFGDRRRARWSELRRA